MKILHTADWHVGKKIGRQERDDIPSVLDEIVQLAYTREVDAVLVAGDLFDRATPALDSLSLVLGTLRALADTGAQVVAIPGNHDSPELFRVLAPLLTPLGIHLVHKALEPDRGGVLTLPARDGKTHLRVACVPFIHETAVIDLMGVAEEGYKSYADRIRKVTAYYARWMSEHPLPDSVDVLMGHFMIENAVPGGTERQLHIGEAYMATAAAIPTEIKYAALGHIHRAQDIPGSAVPGRFSGGLLQLDFGEEGTEKSVCLVDIEPGMRPAKIECAPITTGRPLRKIAGTIERLRDMVDDVGNAFLHVTVKTTGPEPWLADEVRSFLPNALQIHPDYPRTRVEHTAREGRSLTDLYGDYWLERKETEIPENIHKAFASLMDEVGVSW